MRPRLLLAAVLLVAACAAEGTDSVPAGDAASGGNLRADAGSTRPEPTGTGVLGVVTDPSGEPVAGATITGPPADGRSPQLALVTDEQGRFFYAAGPGEWELQVSAQGFETATLSVMVGQGDQEQREIVLQRQR